ncbi:hypothetical protein EV361DRAFT_929243 [Lentinula raphanica]|nr:hypothetical protein EV361DRAFT_929243 [Lentinula raphanica]
MRQSSYIKRVLGSSRTPKNGTQESNRMSFKLRMPLKLKAIKSPEVSGQYHKASRSLNTQGPQIQYRIHDQGSSNHERCCSIASTFSSSTRMEGVVVINTSCVSGAIPRCVVEYSSCCTSLIHVLGRCLGMSLERHFLRPCSHCCFLICSLFFSHIPYPMFSALCIFEIVLQFSK